MIKTSYSKNVSCLRKKIKYQFGINYYFVVPIRIDDYFILEFPLIHPPCVKYNNYC